MTDESPVGKEDCRQEMIEQRGQTMQTKDKGTVLSDMHGERERGKKRGRDTEEKTNTTEEGEGT